MLRRFLVIAFLLCARLGAEVSAFNGVPITTASNVMGVSPLAAVLGQPVVPGGLSPSFSWSMETDVPEVGATSSIVVFPPPEDLPDHAPARTGSPDPVYAGSYALDIPAFTTDPSTTDFPAVLFWNDADTTAWGPVTGAATYRFRWYYYSWNTSGPMIFQTSGKCDNVPALDTNDYFALYQGNQAKRLLLRWAGNNGVTVVNHTADFPTLQQDAWNLITVKYDKANNRLAIKANSDPEMRYSGALAATLANAWHMLLVGNDTVQTLRERHDDFTVYDEWLTDDAPNPTLLVSEEFEGTGLPSGGWTSGATPPDYDYTTTALKGSQSMAFTTSAMSTRVDFTAQSECWVRLMVRSSAVSTNPTICTLEDSSGNDLARLEFRNFGILRLYYNATNTGSAGSTVAVDTTYYIWLRYLKGTGSDGVVQVWLSTTSTRGALLLSAYNLTSTADASRLTFGPAVSSTTIIVDNVLIAGSEIGDGTLP